MSDPVRLLAGGGTELERELLRTWETRQPSSEARAKVLALAGVGVAAGLATVASGAGASIAPKAVASGVLLKWLALAAVGATVTAGAVGYALRAPSVPSVGVAAAPSGTTAHTASALAVTPSTSPTSPTPSPAAADPGQDLPIGPSVAQSPVTASRPSTGAPLAASRARGEPRTLDEEVAMVDRARRAVAGGDGTGAIALVEAYEARFPSGALAQESAEVRIEAYLQKGDRPTAERLAARFIEAHPSSPYVRRIRALLAVPTTK